MHNQLHEVCEEAGRNRVLSGNRKPGADRREDAGWRVAGVNAHGGNLWVGG